MLKLAPLDPIAAKGQGEEEEEKEAPLHFMVLVDLQKGKKSNGLLPFSALIDLDATINVASQAVADSIGMHLAKAERQNGAIAEPLMIATVNDVLLQTTVVIRHTVRMGDGARVERCHRLYLVIDNIASYDIILGMLSCKSRTQISSGTQAFVNGVPALMRKIYPSVKSLLVPMEQQFL
jgi:hypothetical protein